MARWPRDEDEKPLVGGVAGGRTVDAETGSQPEERT